VAGAASKAGVPPSLPGDMPSSAAATTAAAASKSGALEIKSKACASVATAAPEKDKADAAMEEKKEKEATAPSTPVPSVPVPSVPAYEATTTVAAPAALAVVEVKEEVKEAPVAAVVNWSSSSSSSSGKSAKGEVSVSLPVAAAEAASPVVAEKQEEDVVTAALSDKVTGMSIAAQEPSAPKAGVEIPPAAITAATFTPAASAAGKVVYGKVDLERLKPSMLSEPAELVGKLLVSKPPGLSSNAGGGMGGGMGGGRPSLGGLGGSISRSGSSVSTLEEGPWQRKPLLMEARKSTDQLSASSRGTAGGGGVSPGVSSSGCSATAGGGGSAWRRGEQLPKKEGGGGGGEYGRQGVGSDFARKRENMGLARAKNAWSPQRDTSGLEQCEARVRGLLNKMTWDTFEKLSTQLCSIELDSKDMLSKIISLVFDKAVDEPSFGEMYATLCVHVSKKSGEWSVIRTGQDLDKGGKYFWTDDIMVEKEIVGPFPSREACLEAAVSEQEPTAQARTQKLRLSELVITGDKFVKVLESMEGAAPQFFTVFRSLAEEEEGQEKVRDRIHGGFEDEMSAMEDGHRATTFKKLLLKKCQEEFYKENIYDDVVKSSAGSGISKQELAQNRADEEEGRMKAKRRMLGNIRFIGELYKKKMLKEHIMHECILKLLGFVEQRGDRPSDRKLVKSAATWDEESLEALCKLLTTVGKQLDDVKGGGKGEQRAKGRPPPEHHEKDIAFYYKQLKDLSTDKKSGLPARARFMIKDLLELRENDWVPRRIEAKATKTDEFRREIEAVKPVAGGLPGGGGRGGGQGGGGGGGGGGTRSSVQTPTSVSRQVSGDKGAARGDTRGDARGGGGGGERRSVRGAGQGEPGGWDRRGNIPPAAVADRKGGGDYRGENARASRLDRRGGHAPHSSSMDVEGSERRDARAFLDHSVGLKAGGGEREGGTSRKDVERVIHSLIAEFLVIKDEAEVEASIEQVPQELGSEVAANKLLGKLCDCKESQRGSLIQLMLLLIDKNRILSKDLRAQTQLVFETLEDIVVDVPHVYENFAYAMAVLLRTNALDFKWFQAEARNALREEQPFTRLLSAVFRAYDVDRLAPWSCDLVSSAGEVLFVAYRNKNIKVFMDFVEKHQMWATYVEPLSAKIIEQARLAHGTVGILNWVRSLDPGLRNNVPFTRALAFRLLVESPKVPNTVLPLLAEVRTLFTEIAAQAAPRLQVACLHGIQRFVNEFAVSMDRKGMLVSLFDELVRSGAVLPGALSAWEQDLASTPDSALAHDIVIDVMKKQGADLVST